MYERGANIKMKPGMKRKHGFTEDVPRKGKQTIRKIQLLEANEEEDKTINKLEKALGIKKRKKNKKNQSNPKIKKLPSVFAEDGLDFILDVIDNPECEMGYDALDENLSVPMSSHSSNKHEVNTNKHSEHSSENGDSDPSEVVEDMGDEASCSDDHSEDDQNYDTDDHSEDDQNYDSDDDSENDQNYDTDERSEFDNKNGSDLEKQSDSVVPKFREDIYGRLRDAKGNIIPNSTSSAIKTTDEERKVQLERLKKQLNSFLNKLHEQNIHPISTQIEEMYMKNIRNDMNEALLSVSTKRILDPFETTSLTTMQHALLVARLHGNVGSEVGAFFLQSLAQKLDELLQSGGNYGEGLQCDNLLNFLCHLYNCRVTHSTLIFDILRRLADSFHEKDIELIHHILKNVGFSLRKDDPLALRDVVLLIQNKAASLKPQDMSRVNLMLETLKAIRNNNMYKIHEYDQNIKNHMQKVLGNLLCKGNKVQKFDISLADLLKANERGRWWIVGSAWAERDQPNAPMAQNASSTKPATETNFNEKILELARKQHMNTEIRKTIFCILLTAEDYMDAYEKLLRLGLKNQQEREIIYVLLHCSLQEKQFNPYYAYLAAKLCESARRFLICFQFTLWDKFKDLGTMESHQRCNLAHLLIHLFTKGALPISVLKVIQFSDMDKVKVKFFRQLLMGILLHESDDVCSQVFSRISAAPNLKLLRESLRLFMHHFILRKKDQMKPEVAEKLTLRVKKAANALSCKKYAFTI